MKIKDGFILRDVAGQAVVLPSGDTLDLNMMITLNDTGKFLWEHLQQEISQEALVAALLEEYEVEADTAAAAVERFLAQLSNNGLLA